MSHPKHAYGFWFYDELLPLLGHDKTILLPTVACGNFLVTGSNSRLKCLKRSPKCVTCPLVGVLWALESHGPLNPRNESRPHLNLYADTKGGLVLMTQDHILPKSLGGSSEQSNLQTMCTMCNQRKGSTPPDVYHRTVFGTPKGVDERRLIEARFRALEAYADYLASTERQSVLRKLAG